MSKKRKLPREEFRSWALKHPSLEDAWVACTDGGMLIRYLLEFDTNSKAVHQVSYRAAYRAVTNDPDVETEFVDALWVKAGWMEGGAEPAKSYGHDQSILGRCVRELMRLDGAASELVMSFAAQALGEVACRTTSPDSINISLDAPVDSYQTRFSAAYKLERVRQADDIRELLLFPKVRTRFEREDVV
jgi:hypothetical protein